MGARRVMGDFMIKELSGVTRPAQEPALVKIIKSDQREYWKADFTADERKQLAGTGAAMPDGSFPIRNVADLKNAVQAIGRAKNPDAAKRHITARARSLDAVSELPDTWNVSKGVDMSIKKSLGLAETATDEEVGAALTKALEAPAAALKKAEEDLAAAVLKASMSDAEKAHCKDMSAEDTAKFMGKKPEDRASALKKVADDIVKSDETFVSVSGATISKLAVGGAYEILKAQDAELKKSRDDLAIEKAARLNAQFEKAADSEFRHVPGTVVEKAAILKSISDLPEKDREGITKLLKGYETIMASGFSKLGTKPVNPEDPDGDDAEDKLKKGAEALVKAAGGPNKLSFAKAYDQFIQSEEGGELYASYLDQQRAAAREQ